LSCRRRRLIGVDDGRTSVNLVPEHEWYVRDDLQATAQGREQRESAKVRGPLWGIVEPLGEREESQPVNVAVRGVDPALPRRSAGTVRRRHPSLFPTFAEECRERQRPPAVRVGLAEERLSDRFEATQFARAAEGRRHLGTGAAPGLGDRHR